MGAGTAIDASRLALLGDGQHSVSLDKVIATMKRTGEDMSHVYKETSLGGLAATPAECGGPAGAAPALPSLGGIEGETAMTETSRRTTLAGLSAVIASLPA